MKHPRNRAERLEIDRIKKPRRTRLKAVGEDHEIEVCDGEETTQPVARDAVVGDSSDELHRPITTTA